MDNLIRLTYYSRVKQSVSKKALSEILAISRHRNRDVGITGVLYFNREFFVQVLEGEREPVSKTYNRLVTDPRHDRPVIMG